MPTDLDEPLPIAEAFDPLPAAAAAAAAAVLAACGGGGASADAPAADSPAAAPPSQRDAARFLGQASFGASSPAQVDALQAQGFAAWLRTQFDTPAASHIAYLESQRGRDTPRGQPRRVTEEMSYEAVWQQWLRGADQLRGRVSWALLQILVISNIAPDLRAVAMSSYLDLLNRNAFGNYRTLLQDVTLHPAMGYYLNLLGSEKGNPDAGTHPNENYAREVMQLFTVGLVLLNPDGSVQLDAAGKPLPTFGEAEVKGLAAALSGWSFGGVDSRKAELFHGADENDESLWQRPMQPWPAFHADGEKTLLGGRVLPAGQGPQQDLSDALDTLFQHPNVGPFVGRQLIQRLVGSNPSPAYIGRVAAAFADNGSGVRGDLRAVVTAVLLDPEARGDTPPPRAGKLREPVLRFAQLLRALGASSRNGLNDIHYLDSADDALGQSPLLSPSVFNFYAPGYRPAGPLAAAGMVAPEFQITTETTVVGSLNFFADVVFGGGYGDGDFRLELDFQPLRALAGDPAALTDRLDLLFCGRQMGDATRARLAALLAALPADDPDGRVKSALLLTLMLPDHVIQK